MRYTMGSNPPATCMTEVYEPPFNNPKAPGVEGYGTQGVEFDSKGLVWVSLGGERAPRQLRPQQVQGAAGTDRDGPALPGGLDAVSGAGSHVQGNRAYGLTTII